MALVSRRGGQGLATGLLPGCSAAYPCHVLDYSYLARVFQTPRHPSARLELSPTTCLVSLPGFETRIMHVGICVRTASSPWPQNIWACFHPV